MQSQDVTKVTSVPQTWLSMFLHTVIKSGIAQTVTTTPRTNDCSKVTNKNMSRRLNIRVHGAEKDLCTILNGPGTGTLKTVQNSNVAAPQRSN